MWDNIAFWIIQGPGWALLFYLVVAQCLSAFSYELGVRMGTQEPATQITDVGVAFFWGFALADLVYYAPLLAVGLLAHWTGASWSGPVLGAVLGTTVYWPIASLATVWKARGATGWSLPNEGQYWVVLPVIAGWGAVALVLVAAGI